ncbi:MAG TPA: biotin transporter BioY [Candidatus Avacidaminococcus intestinavium]|uniref:Biotin transporter n=1 Tax=Candidatus Avacidaminococcus intestinavium TaxID=2840684 RepID=A0A9D1MPE6_9FIRM|nr:biotin transporter BioY [Candidatus Avacidaminococcus intestinavium]
MQLRNMLLAATFTALMIISSYIVVPIGPVPHTLQPLVVLLSGMLLGPKWGPSSLLVWIALGVLGLPVFNQGQAGAVMLIGPTGGFILGFVVCSWLVGWLTCRDPKSGYGKTFIYLFSGIIIAYAMGMVGFKLSFQYFLQKPMTWEKSIIIAIAPFLPFDIIKTIAATYIGVHVRKALVASGLYTVKRK